MKSAKKTTVRLVLLGVLVVLVTWLSICPTPAEAQTSEGYDAVYNSSGTKVPSPDFIDASMFVATGDTICSTLYRILSGGLAHA